MKSTEDYQRIKEPSNVYWITLSLLSAFSLGLGNFLWTFGISNPYYLKLLGSLGYLIQFILTAMYHLIKIRVKTGKYPTLRPDSILSASNKLKQGCYEGFLGGLCIFLINFTLLLSFHYDPIGSSITLFILLGAIPLSCILTHLILHEKFTKLQITGMTLAVLGSTIIGIDKLEGSWISYICGISSLLLIVARSIASKSLKKSVISSYAVCMLNSLVEIVLGVVLLGFLIICNPKSLENKDYPVSWCILGSILVAFGSYFNNEALMNGHTGGVLTVGNSSSFIFMICDFIVNNNIPVTKDLAALAILSIGVTIIIFQQ